MSIRLNLRFLIASLVILGGVGLGVSVLHGRQFARSVAFLCARAVNAAAEGRGQEAADNYRLYLGFEPSDVAALVAYGRLRLAADGGVPSGRVKLESLYLFERALRLDPGLEQIRPEIVALAMSPDLGQYTDAMFHLKALLKHEPDNAEWLDLTGECLEKMADPDGAAAAYRQAIESDPSRVETYVRLATLLRGEGGDSAEADRVMDARGEGLGLIGRNPERASAYVARARYRRDHGIEGAEADLSRALELAPQDSEGLFTAGEMAIEAGDLERARDLLGRAQAGLPADARILVARARLARRGDRGQAIDELRAALSEPRASTDMVAMRWILIDLLIDEGRLDEAEKVLKDMKNERVRAELPDYLEGRLLVARGEWGAAVRILTGVAPLLEKEGERELGGEVQALLTRCYEELGQPELRLEAARRGVELAPGRGAGRLSLGAALLASGRNEEAISVYRPLVGQAPGIALLVARLSLDRARTQSEKAPNWAEVEDDLNAAAAEATADPALIATMRASLRIAKGDQEGGRRILEEAIATLPDRAELKLALADLESEPEVKGPAPAGLEGVGTGLTERLSRIRYWTDRGGEAGLAGLNEQAEGLEALPTAEQLNVMRELAFGFQRLGRQDEEWGLLTRLSDREPGILGYGLGLYQIALGQGDAARLDEARQRIRTGLETSPPGSARPLTVLCQLALGDADTRLFEESLKRLKDLEGDEGANWRYFEGMSRLTVAARVAEPDRARLLEAQALLEQAVMRRPGWGPLSMALGDVAERLGDANRAVEQFEEARRQGVTDPGLSLRLYRLYASLGRLDQADAQVMSLRGTTPEGYEGLVSKLSAEAASRVNPEGGLAEARLAAPVDSKDYRDHLWLARVLMAAGRMEEADAALRRGAACSGGDPLPWVALVRFLVGSGRLEEACAATAQGANQMAPPARALGLAQCHEATGEVEFASDAYERALAESPDDAVVLRQAAGFAIKQGMFGTAERHLRHLEGLSGLFSGDRDWTRRMLGVVLAAGGDPSRRAEALERVGVKRSLAGLRPSVGDSVEELQARVQVLGLIPTVEARQAAVRVLEELSESRGVGTVDDAFVLARLEAELGSWERARERMQALLTARPPRADVIITYVNWLLDENPWRGRFDPDEAGEWVKRLEKTSPDWVETALLKARWLAAKQRSSEADSTLVLAAARWPGSLVRIAGLAEGLGLTDTAQRLFREGAARPDLRAGPLLLARYLERQGRYEESERILRPFLVAIGRPEARLDLATYLGRRGRLEEAIAQGESCWESCPAEAVASALVSVVNRGDVEPVLLNRVRGGIEKALVAKPESVELLTELGNVQLLQGSLAEAEESYRTALKRAPGSVGLERQLGWLIAAQGAPRCEEALGLIDRAIETAGPIPELLDTRGWILLKQDRLDEAARDIQEALRRADRVEPLWIVHLAQVEMAREKPGEAVRLLGITREEGLDTAMIPAVEKPAYSALMKRLRRPDGL